MANDDAERVVPEEELRRRLLKKWFEDRGIAVVEVGQHLMIDEEKIDADRLDE